MRRKILYPTGLLIAAGASLALAGPASAAPHAPDGAARHCCESRGQGPSFHNQGPSFRGQGRGFRDQGQGQGHGFGNQSQGRGFGDQGRGFRDQGPSFRGQGQGFRGQGPSNQARQPGRGFIGQVGSRGGLTIQYLNQISITNQYVLNNVGNTQIGSGNYNGGGSAAVSSYTSQVGGQFASR
jgi:hypothetical protein